jgi:hypothetical protein
MRIHRILGSILPVAILASGLAARADDAPKAKSSTPFLDKLVASKKLEASDVDAVRKLKDEVKACRADVKAGKAQKGSCVGKMLEVQKARIGLLEKAVEKIKRKKFQKRVKKAIRWTKKQIAKLEKWAAKAKAKAEGAAPKAQEKGGDAK